MKNRIKILHVVPAIYEGGVGSVINNYYEKIDKSKFSFDVITHVKETKKKNNQHYEYSNVLYFKTLGETGIYGYYKQIKSILNCSEYDIIHIHTGHITGLYAAIFRICGAKKIISHAHTTTAPNPNHIKFMPFFRLLTRLFSDKLLSCGKFAGLFCFGRADFEIIKNGIDYNKYINIEEIEIVKLRKEFGFNPGEIILGIVAAFIEQKNYKFLLLVLIELCKIRDNVKLVLVGEGPLKKQCIEFVKDNNLNQKVLFLGQRNDVYQLMNLFDMFLLPSLFEGLPVAGVEAQAAGTKCIFSDRIDKELDFGIGLSVFLPIDKGPKPWVEYLSFIDTKKADKQVVKDAIIANGYEINYSIKELEKIYYIIVNASPLEA